MDRHVDPIRGEVNPDTPASPSAAVQDTAVWAGIIGVGALVFLVALRKGFRSVIPG